MTIQTLLHGIGFADKEIQVYLSILKLAHAKASEIALHTELPRPTVYDVLQSLGDKGVIESQEDGKVKLFVAKHPEALLRFIEKKALEYQHYKKAAEKIIHELIFHTKEKITRPKVKFLDSHEGLLQIIAELHRHQDARLVLDLRSSPDDFASWIGSNKVFCHTCKVLTPHSQENAFLKEIFPQTRMISNITPYTSHTLIYGKTLSLIHFEHNNAQITSLQKDAIAQSQREIFDILWENAD